MFFVSVLVVCFSVDHCELRMPPGDALTWPTVEECTEFGRLMEVDARLTLGDRATHVKWWCIPVREPELTTLKD